MAYLEFAPGVEHDAESSSVSIWTDDAMVALLDVSPRGLILGLEVFHAPTRLHPGVLRKLGQGRSRRPAVGEWNILPNENSTWNRRSDAAYLELAPPAARDAATEILPIEWDGRVIASLEVTPAGLIVAMEVLDAPGHLCAGVLSKLRQIT